MKCKYCKKWFMTRHEKREHEEKEHGKSNDKR